MSSSTGTVVFNDSRIKAKGVIATESIGVGTANPTSNLEVVGNVYVSSNLEVGTANLFVDTVSGNVGIGMTDPGHNLDIVSEMNLRSVSNTASIKYNSNVVTEYTRSKKLIKYPRVALTAASGESSGYQGYYVTESSNSSDTNRQSWKAFEGTTDNSNSDNAWAPDQQTATYNGTDYAYNGTFNLGTGAVDGEWIKLQLPQKIRLEYMKIWLKDNDSTRIPEDWKLYGSDDNTNWTELFSKTGQASINENTYIVNATSMYNYLAVVVTKISGQNNYFRIVELEYYGIPEYDPEAHGTDVVVRSVPNVPNTDWLEVYYDGQDYTSMPSSVTDKSGNGVTGTPNGGVGFDTEYKAFTFDGGNITGDSNSTAGNWIHTMSTWIYFNSLVTNKVFGVNPNSYVYGGHNETSSFYARSSGFIWDFGMQNNNTTTLKPVTNRWYHVTLVADGSGYKKIYIDSELQTSFSYSNNTNIVMQTNAPLNIGEGNLDGSIANFRLFNRALTADEVWQLYAYQKEYFDVSPDVVTFKGGRLGIGTSEPRAPLDIMGIPYGPGATPRFFARATAVTKTTAAGTVRFNSAPVDSHSGFDGSRYTYVVQVAGVYFLIGDVLVRNTSRDNNTSGSRLEIRVNGVRTFSSYGSGRYASEITITTQGIKYLNVGDEVSMYHTSVANGDIYISDVYQGFSGFLLC